MSYLIDVDENRIEMMHNSGNVVLSVDYSDSDDYLSERQKQVYSKLQTMDRQAVADELGISVNTVDVHRQKCEEKQKRAVETLMWLANVKLDN